MGHKWDSNLLSDWLEYSQEEVVDWIGQQKEVTPKDPNVLVDEMHTGDVYGEQVEGDFTGGFTLSVLWSNGQQTIHKVKVQANVVGSGE